MRKAFAPSTPIHVQIADDIRQRIASGRWPPGMRMPPVRELSVEFGVNTNTAQRSQTELEREGLVFTERTTGRFITQNIETIRKMKGDMKLGYTGQFYQRMRAIGYEREDIIEFIRDTTDVNEAAL